MYFFFFFFFCGSQSKGYSRTKADPKSKRGRRGRREKEVDKNAYNLADP